MKKEKGKKITGSDNNNGGFIDAHAVMNTHYDLTTNCAAHTVFQ